MERQEADVGRLAWPQTMGPAVLEHLDQPADEPQQRMDAEEREGRVQQREQSNLDGVDHGVLPGVGGIDMRTEVREIGSGVGVTLGAGMHPVLPARAWNRDRPKAGYRENRGSRRTWRPGHSPGWSICRACSWHRCWTWRYGNSRSGPARLRGRRPTRATAIRAPGGTRCRSVSAWSCHRARGGRPARPAGHPGRVRCFCSRSSIPV